MSSPRHLARLLLLIVLFSSLRARAILPPEIYDQEARNSAIIAIARVVRVEEISRNEHSTTKNVVFQREKGLSRDVPEVFSGTCSSVESGQTPLIGGTIYYYPDKGERVLVTIQVNGGMITSYTPLTPELENEIRQHGIRNITFMGKARLNEAVPLPPRPGP